MPGKVDGYPYYESSILPQITEVNADTPFAVFMNPKKIVHGNRKGIEIKRFEDTKESLEYGEIFIRFRKRDGFLFTRPSANCVRKFVFDRKNRSVYFVDLTIENHSLFVKYKSGFTNETLPQDLKLAAVKMFGVTKNEMAEIHLTESDRDWQIKLWRYFEAIDRVMEENEMSDFWQSARVSGTDGNRIFVRIVV